MQKIEGRKPVIQKPNTNCLKKNVSIGLRCKIKPKVIPRWWMSAKIEGR
ncbi:MAG: hypothetical protein L6V95_10890 [Candidatus Melainabacteria bacterium]|nr:MAG: hypothetical protein L6V95_10890 [Candidatus Melainabacteria bacterium]